MLNKKKILIVDEAGFSRICSAILEKEGYGTNVISDVDQLRVQRNYKDFGVVIISYPYGAVLFDALQEQRVPTIILSDRLNRELLLKLADFDKSLLHCMIKPIDYTKFRSLINHFMGGSVLQTAGLESIVDTVPVQAPAQLQIES